MYADKHPLGEISLKLDAPSTLEKISNTALLELRDEMYSTPRGRKRGIYRQFLLQFMAKLAICILEHYHILKHQEYGGGLGVMRLATEPWVAFPALTPTLF